MTDSVGEQPRSSQQTLNISKHSDNTQEDLCFPQLLLQASFDSLLTHSYPSTTSSRSKMSSLHAPLNSMEGSWTSLEDTEYMNDDDLRSETTDPGSLIDAHGSEDVRSVNEDEVSISTDDMSNSDTDSQSEDNLPAETATRTPELVPMPLHHASPPACRATEDQEITLQECDISHMPHGTLFRHTMKRFSSDEVIRLKLTGAPQRIGCEGTVQMALSDSSLEATGRHCFRLLLFGSACTPSIKKTILEKVGDVLVASGTLTDSIASGIPSRYHVVPDAFGPGSHPTSAEIIPIEWQLEVELYHEAVESFSETEIRLFHNTDIASNAGRSSIWNGHEFVVDDAHWNIPDLAIVCVTRNDSALERSSIRNVFKFAKRHNIPTLTIRLDRDWNARYPYFVLEDHQAQMRIENVRHKKQPHVLQRLPLDLNTFLNLSSAQLNKHFAYLMHKPIGQSRSFIVASQNERTSLENETIQAGQKSWFRTIFGRHNNVANKLRQQITTLLLLGAILGFSLIGFAHLSSPFMVFRAYPDPALTFHRNQTPYDSTILHDPARSNTGLPSVSYIQLQSETIPYRSLQTKDHFEVNVAGSSSLLVKAPMGPRKVRGKDNVQIHISRLAQPIEFEIQHFFDQVYNIRLDENEAYGELEVSLAMKRPSVAEVIKVDLGSPPNGNRWEDFLRQTYLHLDQTRCSLHEALNKTKGYRLVSEEYTSSLLPSMRKFCSKLGSSAQQFINIAQNKINEHRPVQVFEKKMNDISARYKMQTQDLYVEMMHNLHTLPLHSKKLFLKHADSLESLQSFISQLKQHAKLNGIFQPLQEGIRSEKLATAQDRARYIVANLGKKLRSE